MNSAALLHLIEPDRWRSALGTGAVLSGQLRAWTARPRPSTPS